MVLPNLSVLPITVLSVRGGGQLRLQIRTDFIDHVLRMFFHVACPKAEYKPAHFCQCIVYVTIPLDISGEFLPPKGLVCGDLLAGVFPMPTGMPEVTIDENHNFASCDDNIGSAGEGADVLAIADPLFPQSLAQSYFRLCVLGTDTGHTLFALISGQFIHVGL